MLGLRSDSEVKEEKTSSGETIWNQQDSKFYLGVGEPTEVGDGKLDFFGGR
jgi:hypothetical protein